jgi:hypothetical protein
VIEVGTGNKSLKETLIHEIQHAIQEKEGFARGGNTASSFLDPEFQKRKKLLN